MTEAWDVAIVGGGIAGLTAAAFAARTGARVTLLEGAPDLGGRGRTREEGGFAFNHGPHALYNKGAARGTLDALGINPPGAPPATNNAYLVRDGALFRAPTGFFDLVASDLMPAGDKIAFARANAAIAAGFSGRPGETIAAALQRLTKSLPAQAALKALIRVSSYSNAVDIADASALLDQMRLANQGVRYLDGGWGGMIASLTRAACEAGAQIAREARVGQVTREGAGWRVVREDGAALMARAVILAVPPEAAAALAPQVAALARARDAAIPVRAASLDVALTWLPRESHAFALGLDGPAYFSVHSLAAKNLAPAGGALAHATRYLATDEQPTHRTREGLEALIDLMQPGWRDARVTQQWLPLATVTHDLPQAARGGLAGRAQVDAGEGLYLAGDWVGAEGMLSDCAFASGRRAGESAAKAGAALRAA